MKTMILCAALVCATMGCAPKETAATDTTGTTSPETTTASNTGDTKTEPTTTDGEKMNETPTAPENTEDPATRKPKDGEEVAVMKTNQGTIVLMFFPDKAPNHVENFKKLAKEGFYNGTKFHRVIPGFMIQGGDPNSKDGDRSNDGMGGSGKYLNAEFNDVKHRRGILSMARSSDPNSASSQFYIMVADKTHLDGQYSAFGKVVEGMESVDKIVNLERDARDNPLPKNPATIEKIDIVAWPIKK